MEDKRELLEEIVESIPYNILKKMQKEKEILKKKIKKKDPHIQKITVIENYDDINFWNETEKVRIFDFFSL